MGFEITEAKQTAGKEFERRTDCGCLAGRKLKVKYVFGPWPVLGTKKISQPLLVKLFFSSISLSKVTKLYENTKLL